MRECIDMRKSTRVRPSVIKMIVKNQGQEKAGS
jgi:hypothetical protein